ncbi:MAG TPA: hypothetical protein VGK93_07705 [Candidatus Eisenbacteria bacterium]|jgi:hypothetical protein
MFAKRFFYVCAGLLCLAIAYHLGARNAGAQSGSMVSGFAAEGTGIDPNRANGMFSVMTPNGDIFARYMDSGGGGGSLRYVGNFWDGTTPTQQSTFGSVKARYR